MNFRVVEDVVFSHNRPHGAWRWQYRVECSAGSIHNFKAYSPGGATLFDFVVVYDGSNLRTGGKLLSTIASLRYCNDFRVLTTHILEFRVFMEEFGPHIGRLKLLEY